MVIVKITGGLGNQLFQYATGSALANKLSCELVLDLSFYPTQTLRKYELAKFNINARVATDREIFLAGGGNDFFSKALKKLGLTSIIFPEYIKEQESIKYVGKIDLCKSGAYLDGYWQNPLYFSQNKIELTREFLPRAQLSPSALAWKDHISQASNSVSLHVRRGDYVENAHTNNIHGTCSLEYYQHAIEKIRSEVHNPVFFVFSDDIEWCKLNLSSLAEVEFVDNTTSAIDDLMLMRQCKHSIIANSTFSWWGAWLKLDGLVIAPRNWFSSASRNLKGIYPKEWHIL
ncbi:alpha-1,2-fucosyltransferase [Vibrio cyclitrophicus]|uniref:alpha-1,2-fucosyltransferase n=1 Tax=Vibrio cyclitrophicus TaxID=47951 RepID=UPI00029B4852|nr:alpha-1,2-fucosyltransferase [Vibrio cyclitrophicus]OEE21941.1 glycosyl transferase family 11 [Vibrio cyclitrophicus ZF14]